MIVTVVVLNMAVEDHPLLVHQIVAAPVKVFEIADRNVNDMTKAGIIYYLVPPRFV